MLRYSVNGVDIFSVGIPWPFKTPIPIDVSLTVGVGQVQQVEAFAAAQAILRVDYRRTNDVVGRYYTPNAEFSVGDYRTRIASLLVDVYTVPQ
jgi:hypothetical protein